MSPTISAVAAIGLLLGLRHAFEPDHLAAVSTLATRPAARLWSAARLGLVWGLGHTATVGIVVGVVSATSLGLKLAGGIVSLAGGSMLATLALTMIAALVLGTGLPTSAR